MTDNSLHIYIHTYNSLYNKLLFVYKMKYYTLVQINDL